ncbi:MAG: hypothetical protein M3R24_40405, partial [Chloroflexota bacterium]|nr:hypothetical protein [Chloroflexota bacterium]
RVLNILGVERLLEVVIQRREDTRMIVIRVRSNILRRRGCSWSLVRMDFSHGLALHLTPENVAKIHDYNRLFCMEGAVQVSWGAGEL